MATLITKTLKKDGSGDYTTFSAFCAGEAANLVSLDQIMRLEIYKAGWDKATPLTENFVEIGNNFTTDATRYVEFYVPPAERHDFTEDTGFVMTLNTTYGLVFRNDFVVVDGIEFYNLSCSNTTWFAQSNALFKNCLLYDAVGSNIRIQKGENCIAYNYPTTSNAGVAMFGNGSSVNCTAIIIGGAASYGGSVAVNSGVINDSLVYKELDITTFNAYFSTTGDYNGVNRTGEGAPGANSQTNLTTADFNDYANKDFRLNPTSAFATNGTGGGFMGAAVAPSGGGGLTLVVSSIASGESFGLPDVILNTAYLLPSAITTAESFGVPTVASLDQFIQAISVSSLEAFGEPLILTGGVTLAPTSITSQESLGTPFLVYSQLVLVDSITSEESFGIAIISDGVALVIPVGDRDTYQKIAEYLRATDKFVSYQNNEILLEWLRSEGIDEGSFNDSFKEYWNRKGYVGAYNDRWKSWKGE